MLENDEDPVHVVLRDLRQLEVDRCQEEKQVAAEQARMETVRRELDEQKRELAEERRAQEARVREVCRELDVQRELIEQLAAQSRTLTEELTRARKATEPEPPRRNHALVIAACAGFAGMLALQLWQWSAFAERADALSARAVEATAAPATPVAAAQPAVVQKQEPTLTAQAVKPATPAQAASASAPAEGEATSARSAKPPRLRSARPAAPVESVAQDPADAPADQPGASTSTAEGEDEGEGEEVPATAAAASTPAEGSESAPPPNATASQPGDTLDLSACSGPNADPLCGI